MIGGNGVGIRPPPEAREVPSDLAYVAPNPYFLRPRVVLKALTAVVATGLRRQAGATGAGTRRPIPSGTEPTAHISGKAIGRRVVRYQIGLHILHVTGRSRELPRTNVTPVGGIHGESQLILTAGIRRAIEDVHGSAQVSTGQVPVVVDAAAIQVRSEAFACEGLLPTFEQSLRLQIRGEGVGTIEKDVQDRARTPRGMFAVRRRRCWYYRYCSMPGSIPSPCWKCR